MEFSGRRGVHAELSSSPDNISWVGVRFKYVKVAVMDTLKEFCHGI